MRGTDPVRQEAIQLKCLDGVRYAEDVPKRQPPRGVYGNCPLDHLLSRV